MRLGDTDRLLLVQYVHIINKRIGDTGTAYVTWQPDGQRAEITHNDGTKDYVYPGNDDLGFVLCILNAIHKYEEAISE